MKLAEGGSCNSVDMKLYLSAVPQYQHPGILCG